MYVIEIGLKRNVMLSKMCENPTKQSDVVTWDADFAKEFTSIEEAKEFIKNYPDKLLLECCSITPKRRAMIGRPIGATR